MHNIDLTEWHREPPADEVAIRNLVSAAGLALPEEYLAFLSYSNGGEGSLGIEPGWLQMWPAEEVIQANRELNVDEFLPCFFMFGSDGGNELFAFDTREPQPWQVYMVPMIVMSEEDTVVIAKDFAAFVKAIGHPYGDT